MTEVQTQALLKENEITIAIRTEIIKGFKIGDQATAFSLWEGKIVWTCVRITKKMVFLQKQRVSDGFIFPEETRQTHWMWAGWIQKSLK